MIADPQDTIVALASAPGPGARAIIRLSGPRAVAVAHTLFRAQTALEPGKRQLRFGALRLPEVHAELPANLYIWPGPHSYTGQDVVELHTVSSPPIVDLVIAACLHAGGRAAQPGEFTLRAFLAGKLDLTRVEAVLAVIEAGSRDELKQALVQLAGGVARPLQELREDLLDLLADVEAALDFADEPLQFVQQTELLRRLTRGLALVTLLRRQFDQRAVRTQAFRVVLAGRPNAGKSSLFNALTGQGAALVSPEAGTTRDYLSRRLEMEGVSVELIDTAGKCVGTNGIESQGQKFAGEQAQDADLVLLCVVGGEANAEEARLLAGDSGRVVGIATKCDLRPAPKGWLATCALDHQGIAGLRRQLAERGRRQTRPALAPSLSRCRHHVDACLEQLRRAHALALHEDPPELLALELRGALESLGAMVGAVYTDDVLDRIFSRFCIGK